MKLYTKFERNRAIRGGVNAISVFDLMTFNLSVALGSGIIFTKFDLGQLIRARFIAFFDADTLCHAVTLTFDLLTLKVRGTSSVTWSKSVRNLSEIEQSPAELLIILRIYAHVMSRCDLALLPLDLELLQHFECHAFTLCTKFDRNRIIHGWVIDGSVQF